jgi:hypothetical protein
MQETDKISAQVNGACRSLWRNVKLCGLGTKIPSMSTQHNQWQVAGCNREQKRHRLNDDMVTKAIGRVC